MERVLGADVGAILARRFREHGANLHIGRAVMGFRAAPGGRVTATVLDGGRELRCDAVLVAIGAEPSAGLQGVQRMPRGAVAVDTRGRTAVEGVYACGDVAAVALEGGGVRRVEHWTNAAGQGAAVARTILGAGRPYSEPPYFWSDQLGLRLQLVGDTDETSSVAIEGSEDSFTATYQAAGGDIRAVLAANRPQEIGALRRELAVAQSAA
jgi:3-phenylpropionate/trans-cinnamate dioxygenase ferredoxin reductase subunit